MYGNEPFATSPSSFHLNQHGPGSPDSLMSGFSSAASVYQQHPVPPQLVQSSSSSTISSSTSSAAATAYLNETIAKASALPESFYPEFLQYSKESFEQSTSQRVNGKKRGRMDEEKQQFSSSSSSSCSSEEDDEDEQRPSRKQKVE
jgi:hypothetical protein